jgi:hypothetical protein
MTTAFSRTTPRSGHGRVYQDRADRPTILRDTILREFKKSGFIPGRTRSSRNWRSTRSSMRWTQCAIQAAGPEKRKPLGPQTLSFAIGPGRFGRASVRAICAAAGSCASTPSTMIAAVNLVDREASPAPSNKD